MFSKIFSRCPFPSGEAKRTAEVGWFIADDRASVIWDDPAPFSRNLPKPQSAKSVQVCPAAIDFDARHFVVPCPIDINIRIAKDQTGRPVLQTVDGAQSTVRPKHLNQMVTIVNPIEWRHPARPIIQFITPYVFLADDPIYINELPPFLDYVTPKWPGLLIAGRFPIHIWPRPLMWAFEWYDTNASLEIRRGDPWFYLRFDPIDPSRPVRLLEAEATPEVKKYLDTVSSVTNYVNRTYSLFPKAQKRRPARLLFPK